MINIPAFVVMAAIASTILSSPAYAQSSNTTLPAHSDTNANINGAAQGKKIKKTHKSHAMMKSNSMSTAKNDVDPSANGANQRRSVKLRNVDQGKGSTSNTSGSGATSIHPNQNGGNQ